MSIAVAFCFMIVLICSVYSMPVAAATILAMFALKQVMQGYFDVFRYFAGGIGTNVLISLAVFASIARCKLNQRFPNVNFGTPTLYCAVGLFAWSALSMAWSPGRESAATIILQALPYFVLILLLGVQLVSSLEDFSTLIRATMLMGLFMNLSFLTNPEFIVRDGRLVLDSGGGITTSPLTMGSFAAATLIMGTLARGGSGRFVMLLRVASVILGISVAIFSGSRGQVIAGVGVSLLFLPFAAPHKTALSRISSIFGVMFVLLSFTVLFDLITSALPSFVGQRFSAESVLYGSGSSAGTRMANVLVLLQAWLNTPTAPLIGLGYIAFSAIPGGSDIDVYAHNVYAEVVFELGLPGIVLFGTMVYFGLRSAFRNYLFAESPSDRAAGATMLALIFFEAFLLAKQGSLWGLSPIIMYLCISSRIERARTIQIDAP